MRLLNTTTLELHEFFVSKIPCYAILSHRWQFGEVSLQDLRVGRGPEMAGFPKIKSCCAQAALDGWEYVWIDTCCIDKTSSAELSEAINSIYKWYKNSMVCYAYLSDAKRGGKGAQHFSKSKWFTRGWTLQELLAPRSVVFYDCSWSEIGTKSSLGRIIASVARIQFLADFKQASVAQKMSWVSKRETTRIEDMAYCLLGLFDVHMAPLYGEGKHAFIRLQLEILSKSDDEWIFAWHGPTDSTEALLASSPSLFADSANVQMSKVDEERPPYSTSNKGLRMELFLIPSDEPNDFPAQGG